MNNYSYSHTYLQMVARQKYLSAYMVFNKIPETKRKEEHSSKYLYKKKSKLVTIYL